MADVSFERDTLHKLVYGANRQAVSRPINPGEVRACSWSEGENRKITFLGTHVLKLCKEEQGQRVAVFTYKPEPDDSIRTIEPHETVTCDWGALLRGIVPESMEEIYAIGAGSLREIDPNTAIKYARTLELLGGTEDPDVLEAMGLAETFVPQGMPRSYV